MIGVATFENCCRTENSDGSDDCSVKTGVPSAPVGSNPRIATTTSPVHAPRISGFFAMFISRVFHPAAPGEPEAYIVSTSTASTLNTGTHTDVTSEANAMADAPPSALASGTPRIT